MIKRHIPEIVVQLIFSSVFPGTVKNLFPFLFLEMTFRFKQ